MALDTYANLKTAIVRFLRNRTDLTPDVPDFITLAEAQMNRRLRNWRATGRSDATLPSGSAFFAQPADFGGPITMQHTTGDKKPIGFVENEKAPEIQARYTDPGPPEFYTVVGEQLQFIPVPDADYPVEMTYWRSIPALSDSNTTNWVLSKHPDAYLYGALLQSAPFLMNDERIPTWGTLFTAALDDMNNDVMPSEGVTLRVDNALLGPRCGAYNIFTDN